MGKLLIIIGLIIAGVGVAFLFWDKIPFLGKLPGDIVIRKKNFTLYLPIATSIVLSLILTFIIYLINKFR